MSVNYVIKYSIVTWNWGTMFLHIIEKVKSVKYHPLDSTGSFSYINGVRRPHFEHTKAHFLTNKLIEDIKTYEEQEMYTKSTL